MEPKIELAKTDLFIIFKGGRLDIFCSRSFIGEASRDPSEGIYQQL